MWSASMNTILNVYMVSIIRLEKFDVSKTVSVRRISTGCKKYTLCNAFSQLHRTRARGHKGYMIFPRIHFTAAPLNSLLLCLSG